MATCRGVGGYRSSHGPASATCEIFLWEVSEQPAPGIGTDAPPRHAAFATIPPMTIAEFQDMIRERYYATDHERGPARTFLWFTEEIGELAEAIAQRERGDGDPANLREEFADVLAWLATLANITGVDLTDAIHSKYIADGGPAGTK